MEKEFNSSDSLIEDCICALADDNCDSGADFLCEMANQMASVGCTIDSFLHLRTYVIESAKKRDQCPKLIDMKIALAEQKLKEMNDGKKH